MNKAIDNIASNIKDIDDPYAQAVAVYALQLAEHSTKDQALDDLIRTSKSKGSFFLMKTYVYYFNVFSY